MTDIRFEGAVSAARYYADNARFLATMSRHDVRMEREKLEAALLAKLTHRLSASDEPITLRVYNEAHEIDRTNPLIEILLMSPGVEFGSHFTLPNVTLVLTRDDYVLQGDSAAA